MFLKFLDYFIYSKSVNLFNDIEVCEFFIIVEYNVLD